MNSRRCRLAGFGMGRRHPRHTKRLKCFSLINCAIDPIQQQSSASGVCVWIKIRFVHAIFTLHSVRSTVVQHAPDVCHFLHDALLTVTVFDLLAQMCDIFRGVRRRVVVLKILSSIPREPDPTTAKINKPPSWCCCCCHVM